MVNTGTSNSNQNLKQNPMSFVAYFKVQTEVRQAAKCGLSSMKGSLFSDINNQDNQLQLDTGRLNDKHSTQFFTKDVNILLP